MYVKDSDSLLDYIFDWTDWLQGDAISSSSFSVSGSDLNIDSETNDNTTATVWLDGGVAGNEYTLINTISTAAGRRIDKSITIIVHNA